MAVLLDNQTSNGNGSAVEWYGGIGTFTAYGTFDSATVKMQMSPDGGTTWIDVGSNTELTADGVGNFEIGAGAQLRANVASGGGSLSVSAEIKRVAKW